MIFLPSVRSVCMIKGGTKGREQRGKSLQEERQRLWALGAAGFGGGAASALSCLELQQQNCGSWAEGTRRDAIVGPGCRRCFALPCSMHRMVLAKPQRRWDCPCGVMVLPLSPIPMGCTQGCAHGTALLGGGIEAGAAFVLQHSPAAALGSTELSTG